MCAQSVCVIRRISGIKTLEVNAGREKLNIEELHNLQSTPIVITVVKTRHIAHMKNWRDEKCIQQFNRKHEGKRQHGVPIRRC
jgi:hypothetical protein